jgi:putative oxidoreductase
MFDLTPLTDFGLLLLRVMAGLNFADSGYLDLKDPDGRGKSLGLSKGFTIFLGVAEVVGGVAVIIGVLQQLAAIGLIIILLGAIQKKLFVWKTGFWGKASPGWYYESTIISMLLVILFTDGGRFVLVR